ncbi:hypothetical protein ACE3MQ_27340, partial [Paenibacillus lentus]
RQLHGRKPRPRSCSGCAAGPPPAATAESWAGGRRSRARWPPAAQPAAAAAAPGRGADAGRRPARLPPAGARNNPYVPWASRRRESRFSSRRPQAQSELLRLLLKHFHLYDL